MTSEGSDFFHYLSATCGEAGHILSRIAEGAFCKMREIGLREAFHFAKADGRRLPAKAARKARF